MSKLRFCDLVYLEKSNFQKPLKFYAYDDKVVFVNLCLAWDHQTWLNYLSKYQIEGQNYFFNADATAIFTANYGVSGYPTFMLVDAQCKIVNKYVPRSSNILDASAAIDKLIK